MRWRFTIPWKIGIGFGVFMIVVATLFLLTRNVLHESRKINAEINEVFTPAIERLEDLSREVNDSKMLIHNWVTVQSREDVLEKITLNELIQQRIPNQLVGLDTLALNWSKESSLQLDSLHFALKRIFIVYQEIGRMLPNFQSYSDLQRRMDAEFLILDGEIVDQSHKEIEHHIDVLLTAQRQGLIGSTKSMDKLGDQLTWYAGNLSVFVLIFGLIIAFTVSRSIVKPVSELKRTLLYLGKGIYPRNTVSVTADEIGDMAFAVNRLVDGLKKTREFSSQVGAGNFEAQYTPLSEDDELGYALLKMRDDLAANERLLERKVEERTNEVVRQKEEIERQKERVTELYKDLTDSINYAKRIQQTILPTKEYILDMFPKSFVLYKPRDIVSGDFYWFKTSGKKKLFAAVDCTGHGVPGAFMSLVGHNVLNQVTKVFTKPAQILNNLNRLASEALHTESEGETQLSDGMDLAFLSIDYSSMELEFAGAFNPAYIIREGELIVLEPDRFSIGSFEYGEKEYKNQVLQLEKDDMIYIFSDGYVDQFGGPKGKKFMKKKLRELLLQIAHLEVEIQHQKLNEALITWKRSLDQVDDILMVGVRV